MRNIKFIVNEPLSKLHSQLCNEVKIDDTLFIFENVRSKIESQIVNKLGNQIQTRVEHKSFRY